MRALTRSTSSDPRLVYPGFDAREKDEKGGRMGQRLFLQLYCYCSSLRVFYDAQHLHTSNFVLTWRVLVGYKDSDYVDFAVCDEDKSNESSPCLQ